MPILAHASSMLHADVQAPLTYMCDSLVYAVVCECQM